MESRIRQTLSRAFDQEVAENASLENLGGHASLRIYWRITLSEAGPRAESTLMAMVLPEGFDPGKSEEGGENPETAELPFVNVQRYLARLGLPVGAIDFVDMELGVLLLEDLGNTMFENIYLNAPDQAEAHYQRAIDLLVDFQVATLDDGECDCIGYEKSFDEALLLWELDHYREWGLDEHYGAEQLGARRDELQTYFQQIVDKLLDLPQTLVLRDYQSRNIMEKGGVLHLIDFQDALMGPFVYDLVALLRDSYIVLDPELVARLVAYYVEAGQAKDLPWCEDEALVKEAFYLQTVQRKLKDAGRFIFIDKVKGNPNFLPYYEPSIGYVQDALERLEFTELAQLLSEVEPAFGKE